MELVKQSSQLIEFTPDQEALIKKQLAPNASKDELALFLYQCKRTGLDPLTRQIYCIHRGGKMTIQTSIDGFRVIAERSGSYAGQDEPEWVEDDKGKITKCTVKVYRFAPNGQRYCAGVGVAYWSEYAQPGPMWTKMGHTMIAKCAEALALRKAFPQDLSGLYTSDEMQQAGPITEDTTAVVVEIPTYEEKGLLITLLNSTSLEQGTEAYAKALNSITSCGDYKTYEKIQHRLESLQKEPVNKQPRDINKDLRRVQSEA
jgi:phage recombination protein Bet